MTPVWASDLEGAARRHWQCEGLLEGLQRLSAGASAETWSFDFIDGASRHACILRMDALQSDASMSLCISKAQEFAALTAVRKAQVKAPEPCFMFGAGYVMGRVEGETLPRKILRDEGFAHARAVLTEQCAETLARLHGAEISGAVSALPDYSVHQQLDALESQYHAYGAKLPVFELAFRWLREHAPASVQTTLVHGDFRNGNLLVDAAGLAAVLDWELAHLGDPAEDLGWLCVNAWRFGNPHLPVGGFGTRETLLDAYARHSGRTISLEQLHYWEVFGNLRWGIICLFQVFSHLQGHQQSVELAAIGRRIPEVEMDLLVLLSPALIRQEILHA